MARAVATLPPPSGPRPPARRRRRTTPYTDSTLAELTAASPPMSSAARQSGDQRPQPLAGADEPRATLWADHQQHQYKPRQLPSSINMLCRRRFPPFLRGHTRRVFALCGSSPRQAFRRLRRHRLFGCHGRFGYRHPSWPGRLYYHTSNTASTLGARFAFQILSRNNWYRKEGNCFREPWFEETHRRWRSDPTASRQAVKLPDDASGMIA